MEWYIILDNLSHPSECEPDVSESRGPLLQTIPSVSVSGSMSLYWGCQGVSKTAKPLDLEKTARPQKISAKTEKPHENLPKTAVRQKIIVMRKADVIFKFLVTNFTISF